MALWKQVFIGLISGILVGLALGEQATIFQPLGTIFINLILMIVIPLIFFVLINGITQIKPSQNIKKIGLKAIVAFLSTSAIAVLLGIITTSILKPGVGANLQLEGALDIPLQFHNKNFSYALLELIPTNILKSMVEGKILHVILFAFFTGFTLRSINNKCEKIIILFQEMASLMLKMIENIVKIAPIGVFGYISWLVGTQGIEVILNLGKLIGVVLFCCLLQYILFGVIIAVFGRLSPLPFYKKMVEPQILALSTSSSKAALTSLIKVAENKLGISKVNSNFLLPLSTALNMDGGALYLGCTVIFFAQVTGMSLGIYDYLVLTITCTIGSIGAAGIPSGILLFLGMALTSVNLPIEAVAIVAGIDRILDMVTTMINVTGDACLTLVIDKTENLLDEEIYYANTTSNSNANIEMASPRGFEPLLPP